RMDRPSLASISRIQRQHYNCITPQDDFVQKIFPFEEGIKLAELLHGRLGDINELPMMVTRASKSRMTEEELLSTLIPDPRKRTPTPREFSMYCFILGSDMKAWRW